MLLIHDVTRVNRLSIDIKAMLCSQAVPKIVHEPPHWRRGLMSTCQTSQCSPVTFLNRSNRPIQVYYVLIITVLLLGATADKHTSTPHPYPRQVLRHAATTITTHCPSSTLLYLHDNHSQEANTYWILHLKQWNQYKKLKCDDMNNQCLLKKEKKNKTKQPKFQNMC